MITGKILRTEQDARKNIVIVVEFSDDKKVIVPEWSLYARFENFLGMAKEQISEWIRINIEYQIGNLIKASNQESINQTLMGMIETLKETVYQTDKVEVTMEASKVIETPYIATIAQDGTITVK